MIIGKYGEEGGWCSKGVREEYGMGLRQSRVGKRCLTV